MGARAAVLLPRPTWLRALRAITVVLVVVFCVSTVPGLRSHPGFVVPLDGWLQGGCYVLLASVIVVRPLLTSANRLLWSLLAGAVLARALGFVIALGWVRRMDPQPYPSPADAFWVLSSVLLLVLLAGRIRQFAPRLTLLVVLDGITGGVVMVAATLWVLISTLGGLNPEGTPRAAIVVNLTYPALDVALLVVAATAVTVLRSRLTRVDGAVVLAIIAFAVVDVTYLVKLANGTWRPGTMIAALSMLATASLAFSAWIPPRRRELPPPDHEVEPGVALTLGLATLCVIGTLADNFVETPTVVVVMEAVALVLALVRGVITLASDRTHAGRVLGVTTDDLLRFQALVQASNDFIAIADPSGQLLYVNPGGRRITGLADDADVTAMSIPDLLPTSAHDYWRTVRQPAILRDGEWHGEGRLRRLDGRADIPVEVSTFVIKHPEDGVPFAMASIQRDITERLLAETELAELANQRARLLTRLVQAQEDERSRVAADVHDDSVQALAAVELRLGVLHRQLEERAPELTDTVGTLSQTVALATERLRHLLFDLESPARRSGLADALAEASAFVFEDTGVRCRIVGDLTLDLSVAERVTAYRITKEAMVNARQHARAKLVTVELSQQEGGIQVVVADDGRGIEPGADVDRPGHLGLSSMRDRATVAGGLLDVRRRPQGGTEVRLWLPVAGEAPVAR